MGAILLLEHRLVPRAWSISLTILSLVLIGSVVALERANVLMEYGTWARKGMPGG